MPITVSGLGPILTRNMNSRTLVSLAGTGVRPGASVTIIERIGAQDRFEWEGTTQGPSPRSRVLLRCRHVRGMTRDDDIVDVTITITNPGGGDTGSTDTSVDTIEVP